MRSAADILSISTGRETILIGPLSSFGGHAAKSVLRERHTIFQTLQLFVSRPNAEEMLRPHLRRWGVDVVSVRATTRHSLVEALARAAATGAIGVARVPEVTLSFAGASLDDDVAKASIAQKGGAHLPPDLTDRMVIVFEMSMDHMQGETRIAFEEAVKGLGMAVVVGGVCAWIGAHFIPGVNIAVLAFDLFFLSTEVLHALEKAAEIIDDVRAAKSRDQLDPAAQALAAVLAVLVVNGVLNRLLKAKSLTKGVGKTGGPANTKPNLKKKAPPKKQPEKVRDRKEPEPEAQGSPPDGNTSARKAEEAVKDHSARREELNRKFGRTGDIDRDINRRHRKKTAEEFYRRAGMPEEDIPSHVKGIDLDHDVRVENINRNKTLYQYQVPGNGQGEYYSPTENVRPGDLGIAEKGVIRSGPDAGTVAPRELRRYRTVQKTDVLRSTAAPVEDTWSVPGQNISTEGGARQIYIPREAGIPPKEH